MAQAWQDNPRTPMIEHLEAGDLLVLDLHSECRTAMGGPGVRVVSAKEDTGSMSGCTACCLNFGGNIGFMVKWMR